MRSQWNGAKCACCATPRVPFAASTRRSRHERDGPPRTRIPQRGGSPMTTTTGRRNFIAALLLAVSSVLGLVSPGAFAQESLPPAEWKAIQRVIAEQRAALHAGDAKKAFAYASPGIRTQFNDAATFMSMVRDAYASLLTARYVEFLDGAVIEGLVIQPMRLIDADNTVRVALYTMEMQKDGSWRISSCRIAPSTVLST